MSIAVWSRGTGAHLNTVSGLQRKFAQGADADKKSVRVKKLNNVLRIFLKESTLKSG